MRIKIAIIAVLAFAAAACAAPAESEEKPTVERRSITGQKGFDPKTFVKPSEEELKASLTQLQYNVTQHEGTEAPFRNEYDGNKKAGIYVDIVSGEPLFSSLDKFDSGTGWPSFVRVLEPDNIVEKKDTRLFATRTEIRSKHADSHLGHVFPDGPQPTGMRYCMNSAAMRFIPVETLEEEGYGEYAKLFGSTRSSEPETRK